MADSKIFMLSDGIVTMDVAHAIEGFFEDKKGLLSEIVETPNGIIIQAKQKDSWKKLVGMDNSVQVQLFDQGQSVVVNVGSGKWIDKAGAAAVGAFVFAPLAITAALGAWANKKLPEEIFDYVERFIVTGGKTAGLSMRMSGAIKDSEIVCPKCKAKNSASTKFCNSCGEKLTAECPKCGVSIKPGVKFCPECGANVVQETQKVLTDSIVRCEKCSTVIPENTKFCPQCGTPAPVILEAGMTACPNCRKIVPETTKFCPDCGGAIPQKVVPTCSKCGAVVQAGARFCPECGGAL